MSVSTDEQRIRNLFERVETIEEVAVTLPQGDDRRTRLLAVSRDALAEEATVRPVIAAKILGLSEKTVRAWADAGLLTTTQRSPRMLLDVPAFTGSAMSCASCARKAWNGTYSNTCGTAWRTKPCSIEKTCVRASASCCAETWLFSAAARNTTPVGMAIATLYRCRR